VDPNDATERGSIFSRPDPEAPMPQPRPPTVGRESLAPPLRDEIGPPILPPPSPKGRARLDRRTLAAGGAGLVLLAVAGFAIVSFLGPDPVQQVAADVSPSASASASGDPVPSASPAATPSPTPTSPPTPTPTPAGPPAEVAVGAWSTVVVDELNVRGGVGFNTETLWTLVKGAVVTVAEGPSLDAGMNWYRVASLGGAVGWVSAGWVSEPYLETLVDDPTLIRCGKVGREVFDIVNGAPVAHDPLLIGDLAVPAAAFDEASLGTLELLRGMDTEACFSAQVGADGLPKLGAELQAYACGHAAGEGGFYRLRPDSGGNVSLASQVKDPVVVHPSLLNGGPPDDRKSSNLWTLMGLMANEGVSGCLNISAITRGGQVEVNRNAEVALCATVQLYDQHSLKLTPASGGQQAWVKLTASNYQAGQFPIGPPTSVYVSAHSSDADRSAYAWRGQVPGCG
jgi:hypothetical protein